MTNRNHDSSPFVVLANAVQATIAENDDGSGAPGDVSALIVEAMPTLVGRCGAEENSWGPASSLPKIDLRGGFGSAKSYKVQNVLLRPLDWVSLGWKAATVSTLIPVYGAWAALGYLAALAELMKLFTVKLSYPQGQVVNVLSQNAHGAAAPVTVDFIRSKLEQVYGLRLRTSEVRVIVSQLSRVGCVRFSLHDDTVELIEEIVR